jgi:hypothetical protein
LSQRCCIFADCSVGLFSVDPIEAIDMSVKMHRSSAKRLHPLKLRRSFGFTSFGETALSKAATTLLLKLFPNKYLPQYVDVFDFMLTIRT